MISFTDTTLGEVTVTKRRGVHSVRIKIGTNGRYVVTAPYFMPLIAIKQLVRTSRNDLIKLKDASHVSQPYADGQTIAKEHQLAVIHTQMVKKPSVKVAKNRLLVYLPPTYTIEDAAIQQQIKDAVIKILRKEAKAYLPQRLAQLARDYGFHYDRIQLRHAGGRWGSCSSNGTISLNIALMRLPDQLIDYVLIHELSHTRHMNHSKAFWREVGQYDSHYRTHQQLLKHETPIV